MGAQTGTMATTGQGRWEHFEHKADIGVRGIGVTKEAAFEQGAIALMAVITEPAGIEAKEEIEIHCQAPDDELLFADWLNRLVYEMATRGMLFGKFRVRINGGKLQGRAWGEKVDAQRHQPAVEVKAASYTALSVRQNERGEWVAQCVVDV
jgi:SHS2 domain-containing protein